MDEDKTGIMELTGSVGEGTIETSERKKGSQKMFREVRKHGVE